MIRPATAPGGGSRSPVTRIATESRAAGPKNGEKLVASRPPTSHTSRTTCAAPTMAPPAMSSGRNGLERIPRLIVAPIAAPRGLAGEDESPDAEQRDQGSSRLLDLRQWLVKKTCGEQGEREPDDRPAEADDGTQEAGTRAGEGGEGEQDEHEEVEGVHRGRQPSAAITMALRWAVPKARVESIC